MAYGRVTGPITDTRTERVVSRKDGTVYDFHYATVLVAGRSTIDVRFNPARLNGLTFATGDAVDWLINLDTFGGRLTVELEGEYPRHLRESEALAFLAAAEQAEQAEHAAA